MSKQMLQAMHLAMLSRIALSMDTRMSTYGRTDSRRTGHLDLLCHLESRARGVQRFDPSAAEKLTAGGSRHA